MQKVLIPFFVHFYSKIMTISPPPPPPTSFPPYSGCGIILPVKTSFKIQTFDGFHGEITKGYANLYPQNVAE
jgi:hypothetical protein